MTTKNVTGKRKKKLKSLIGFLSASTFDNYNREGGKKKENPKNLHNKSKNENNTCFS